MSSFPTTSDTSRVNHGPQPSHKGPSAPLLHSSVRPWESRPQTFRDVIKNLMDIEGSLVEHGYRIDHDDLVRAYSFEHATQVADHTAKILAKVCRFDDPRKHDIFQMVARSTICSPKILVAMTMATNIEEFCRAVPAYLHPSCGLCGAVRREIETKIVQDPDRTKSWSQRIHDAVINAADLGIKFE